MPGIRDISFELVQRVGDYFGQGEANAPAFLAAQARNLLEPIGRGVATTIPNLDMSPERRRDAERTRAEILDIATAEFAERCYSGARVDEIADRTLYNEAPDLLLLR